MACMCFLPAATHASDVAVHYQDQDAVPPYRLAEGPRITTWPLMACACPCMHACLDAWAPQARGVAERAHEAYRTSGLAARGVDNVHITALHALVDEELPTLERQVSRGLACTQVAGCSWPSRESRAGSISHLMHVPCMS